MYLQETTAFSGISPVPSYSSPALSSFSYRNHQSGSLTAREMACFSDSVSFSTDMVTVTIPNPQDMAEQNHKATFSFQKSFRAGDTIEISGCMQLKNNGYWSVKEVSDFSLKVIGSFTAATETTSITFERGVPHMDYVVEHGNRMWGCSSKDNTIYASALGDPFNWYKYPKALNAGSTNGIPKDSDGSWFGEVGSGGVFTGAVSYLGCPMFFKEDAIYKIYGDMATNFSASSSLAQGISKGDALSALVVNEVLYYKTNTGIVRYSGGVPQKISDALGTDTYTQAVAGNGGHSYYVSMKDSTGNGHLFAYDTRRGLWFREDNTTVTNFSMAEGELLFLDSRDSAMYQINGSSANNAINWYAETGDLNYGNPENRILRRVELQADISTGSFMTIDAQYRRGGDWQRVRTIQAQDTQTYTVPIVPVRSDYFRIRLSGTGACRIYAMKKYFGGTR